MDIQGLKDKILQLAIQGKLVEQDKKDEPASALLNRIKEERDKLVKEKKIKKQKPLPEITEDEKPFEMPESWEWVRLGEVGTIVGGGTPKTAVKEYWEGGTIPWLTPADLSNYTDKYISRGKRSITPLGLKESSAQLMPKGTVLFSSRAPIGYTVIAQNEISTNQGFKSCIPFIINMNKYLYYYLIYSAKLINENASGTTFKEVSGAEVGNLILPLPPLVEQKRIVEKVDELFALIDELDSYKEDLLEVINLTRNQVLQEAIQGKLVKQNPEDEPASVLIQRIKEERDKLVKEGKIRKEKQLPEITEEEKPFEIPRGWEWVRLGDVTNYSILQTLKPDDISNEEWVLELEDIEKETSKVLRVLRNKERQSKSNKYKFHKGDVLYGKLRPYLKKVLVAPEEGVCSTEIIPFRGYCGIKSKYIMYYMKSPYTDTVVNNITHGMDMPRLGTRNAISLLIPLPPLAEQKRIVEKLDIITIMLDELESELTNKM